MASAAPAPSAPVHLTGSGNKAGSLRNLGFRPLLAKMLRKNEENTWKRKAFLSNVAFADGVRPGFGDPVAPRRLSGHLRVELHLQE